MLIHRYVILMVLLALLSCRDEFAPSASFTYLISTYTNTVAKPNFDQCAIRYAFRNSPKTLNISNLQKSLEIPFDLWQQANGYLEFTRVTAGAIADISFVFSDSIRTSNICTDVGLLTQPISILSQLVKQPSGAYIAYLRDTHRWDISSLQRVMLFQIGAALGLPTSANPESAMSNQLYDDCHCVGFE